MVGDSSTQWELRAVTTSVCLRYGLLVVRPTTNSFIIRHKNITLEKRLCCYFVFLHQDWTSLLFEISKTSYTVQDLETDFSFCLFQTNHFICYVRS